MSTIQISGIADEAGDDIASQIRAHKELGWNLIDLRKIDGKMITDISDAEFHRVEAALAESGLHVANFASGICCWGRSVTGDFQMDVEELKRAIPRMQRTNCRTIRVMSCPQNKDERVLDAEWKTEVVRRLRVLTRMAEEAGVILIHENAGGWAGSDPQRQLDLLAEVDSPFFQLLFDMGNFPDGETSWACYEAIRNHVVYLHIKDRTPAGCCLAGEGMIPVAQILNDMAARGYDGVASIEPHIAAMHHTGKSASSEVLHETYLRAGRAATALVDQANARVTCK